MNKIIYSLRIMLRLVEMGHVPVSTIPNPKYPQFDCWIFKVDEDFEEDLNKVLGGNDYGK